MIIASIHLQYANRPLREAIRITLTRVEDEFTVRLKSETTSICLYQEVTRDHMKAKSEFNHWVNKYIDEMFKS